MPGRQAHNLIAGDAETQLARARQGRRQRRQNLAELAVLAFDGNRTALRALVALLREEGSPNGK